VKSIFNYKKPTFWIIVAAVIVCIVVAVCFLSTPKSPSTPSTSETSPGSSTLNSPPISFDSMKIIWATALDLRPDIPTNRYLTEDLTEDALKELASRLTTLKFNEKDDTLTQRTPSHTITIYADKTGLFAIAGYDDDETTALVYDGALYRIDDTAFSEYLSSICSDQTPLNVLEQLKAYFPEYFDLPTDQGFEVYIWQTGHLSYSCTLTAATGRDKTSEELSKLKGVSIIAMKMILSTYEYDLPAEDINIIPFRYHPISSLWYNIDDSDIKLLKNMLFTKENLRTNVTRAYIGSNSNKNKNYIKCLNGHFINQDGWRSPHLPVYKFDTKDEFDQFKSAISDTYLLDYSYNYDEIPSFNEVTAKYDDNFFAENTLLLSYIWSDSGSYRYDVYDIDYDPLSFCMYVARTNNPSIATDDSVSWYIMLEMSDADIRNCKSFDAQRIENPEIPDFFPLGYHDAEIYTGFCNIYADLPGEKKELDRICDSTEGGINPRQMAIAVGILPQNAPRLELKRVKRICSKLSSDQYSDVSVFEIAVADKFDFFVGGPDFYEDGGSGVTRREYYINDAGTELIKLEGPLVIYINKSMDEHIILFKWSDEH
jgi:hypothetical protein